MSTSTSTIFIIIYAIAFLLLLGSAIAGLMKGKTIKTVFKEAMPSLGIMLGSLILWYVYIYVVDDFKKMF